MSSINPLSKHDVALQAIIEVLGEPHLDDIDELNEKFLNRVLSAATPIFARIHPDMALLYQWKIGKILRDLGPLKEQIYRGSLLEEQIDPSKSLDQHFHLLPENLKPEVTKVMQVVEKLTTWQKDADEWADVLATSLVKDLDSSQDSFTEQAEPLPLVIKQNLPTPSAPAKVSKKVEARTLTVNQATAAAYNRLTAFDLPDLEKKNLLNAIKELKALNSLSIHNSWEITNNTLESKRLLGKGLFQPAKRSTEGFYDYLLRIVNDVHFGFQTPAVLSNSKQKALIEETTFLIGEAKNGLRALKKHAKVDSAPYEELFDLCKKMIIREANQEEVKRFYECISTTPLSCLKTDLPEDYALESSQDNKPAEEIRNPFDKARNEFFLRSLLPYPSRAMGIPVDYAKKLIDFFYNRNEETVSHFIGLCVRSNLASQELLSECEALSCNETEELKSTLEKVLAEIQGSRLDEDDKAALRILFNRLAMASGFIPPITTSNNKLHIIDGSLYEEKWDAVSKTGEGEQQSFISGNRLVTLRHPDLEKTTPPFHVHLDLTPLQKLKLPSNAFGKKQIEGCIKFISVFREHSSLLLDKIDEFNTFRTIKSLREDEQKLADLRGNESPAADDTEAPIIDFSKYPKELEGALTSITPLRKEQRAKLVEIAALFTYDLLRGLREQSLANFPIEKD